MQEVWIYTDGACSGNPGPGGWAAIVRCAEGERELSGGEPRTTNQRMELTAAVVAMEQLKEPARVHLVSDSAYLVNAIAQNWFARWEKNGWKTAKRTPVENRDLWERLLTQLRRHTVLVEKVVGHAGHPENERCDRLARQAIPQLR
ncbi:MAG: ribonuclease HI [Firmicutes bacterium]|nr:ribonuclease HI [Bacillota bacterium]